MSTAQPPPSLQDEINEFGKQLAEAMRLARESARGKQVEQQVRQTWNDLEKYVTETFSAVRTKVDTPEFKEQVAKSAQDAADELQKQLAIGLRAVNEKIKKALEESK